MLLSVPIQAIVISIFLGLYLITIISLVLVVITENRNPLKTIPWVLVLLLVPGLGLLIYFFFGQDNRKQRIISRHTYRRIMNKPKAFGIPSENVCCVPDAYLPLSRLLENSSQATLLYGSKITVYTDGESKYKDLLYEIEQAKYHIHMEYYIFLDDKIGRRLKDALVKKAQEGVSVRIIYDDVGSWKAKNRFFREMKEVGIEVHAFLRVAFPYLTSRVNYRNHRKVVVIDGRVGFMGGMNIADRYVDGVKWGIWRDTHFKIEGKGAHGLQSIFLVDWYVISRKYLKGKSFYAPVEVYDDTMMQMVTSGPIGEHRTLLQGIIFSIANAKKYIYIQTPYFLPTESLNQALITAAMGGIDVRLMLPEKADTIMVNQASHSYLDDMIQAGVKVYMYQPGFLHAKVLVFDDQLTCFGSANMDFRSFEHNFENNAFVYHQPFAKKMKKIFLEDQRHCRRIIPSEWLKRPSRLKMKESIMRLFAPLL